MSKKYIKRFQSQQTKYQTLKKLSPPDFFPVIPYPNGTCKTEKQILRSFKWLEHAEPKC